MARETVEDLTKIIHQEFGVAVVNAKLLIGRGYVALDGRVIGANEIKKPRRELAGVMLRVAKRGEVRLFGSRRAEPDPEPQMTLGGTR